MLINRTCMSPANSHVHAGNLALRIDEEVFSFVFGLCHLGRKFLGESFLVFVGSLEADTLCADDSVTGRGRSLRPPRGSAFLIP